MINCNSTTFLNTEKFQTYFLHFFGCFAIPVHILGAYCILFKTPPTMSSVKKELLNFHFWSCFLDIGLSLLSTPYLVLPSLAGYTIGILNLTGLRVEEQAYIMMTTVGLVIWAVIVIFEKRFTILLPRNRYWRLIRIPWLVIDFFFALTFFIPTYINYPNQEIARTAFIKFFGCMPPYIKLESVFFLEYDTFYQLVIYCVVFQSFFFQIFAFAVLTDRILNKQINMNASKHTISLQRTFQKALILQVVIPVLIIFIPSVYVGLSAIAVFHYQYLNNFSVIILSSHGFFSTIAMLTIHRPYREYIKHLVKYQVFVWDRENLSTDINLNSIT
uniref:Serpentine Receptor, class H n=1 Tax=Caenorhabditis tropicalis TaxID=1561998 RepID=A0A1I7SYC0_9PELO